MERPISSCEHITRRVAEFEASPSQQDEQSFYRNLAMSCYHPDITDHDYPNTLDEFGLGDGRAWMANVEALDLRSTIAVLTFVLRADHFCEGALAGAVKDGYVQRVLRRLAELDGAWERPNVVTFYHEYERDGYLSNWYGAPFEVRGKRFPTSEHWMMWQKAAVFGDWDTADRVLEAATPADAKQLGRQVKPFVPKVWDQVSVPLMRVGLRQKFVQNERLMNDLLSTGSAALAEASPTDRVWGVGLGKADSRLDDPGEWRGRNLLGITLMEVRSEIRQLWALGKRLEWSIEDLATTQLWKMSLLELARVPATRPAALMYATIVVQNVPGASDAHSVLRKYRQPIGDIHEAMLTNMGGGLPVAGWYELLDELALQVRLGRV